MPKKVKNHHPNYGPFIRYIENHIGIDDPTVQRAKAKLGTIKSNNINANSNTNNNNDKTNNNNNNMSVPNYNNKQVFSDQTSQAMTKAEKDDARHADLHANVKTKDLTDSDKIFLLKREIDNLQGQLKGTNNNNFNNISNNNNNSTSFANNIPMLSALLFFGIALFSARFLRRKLYAARTSGSLLLDSEQERNYEYNNDNQGIEGFELQGGLFSKLATQIGNSTSTTTTTTNQSVVYAAPSDQANLQFV